MQLVNKPAGQNRANSGAKRGIPIMGGWSRSLCALNQGLAPIKRGGAWRGNDDLNSRYPHFQFLSGLQRQLLA